MSLSFKDSQKSLGSQQAAIPSLMTLRASTFALTDFQISDKYEYYNNYSDSNASSISESKDITVKSSQVNLTKESNSQYIPFEMDRFYDGIDLMEMTLKIHFVNKEQKEYYSDPVNVSYNDSKIKFGWLIDEYVTYVVGQVRFEIIATGINEKGQNYVWRTKPNGLLNILDSLTSDGIIETLLDTISNKEIDKIFS